MTGIFFFTVFMPLLPIGASFLIWKKQRGYASLFMWLGFVVAWISANVIYLGARHIWPNQMPPNLPEEGTMQTISIISGISDAGLIVAYLSFTCFAYTFYTEKK